MGIEEEIRTLEVIIAELGSRADPSSLVYTMRTRAPVFHCEASPMELLAAKQGLLAAKLLERERRNEDEDLEYIRSRFT